MKRHILRVVLASLVAFASITATSSRVAYANDGQWVTRIVVENGQYVLVFIGQIVNGVCVVADLASQLRVPLGPVPPAPAPPLPPPAVTTSASGGVLRTVLVVGGKVVIVVGIAVVATIAIDRAINGDYFWEAPGFDLLWSGVDTGPIAGAITVGCNEDIPAACRTAVNRIVLSPGTFWDTTCADRPNDARCVNALNSCVAQTTANCQANPAAALANFHNAAVDLAALQAVEAAVTVE